MYKYLSKTNLFYFIGKALIMIIFLLFGFESISDPSIYSGLVPSIVADVLSPENLVMIHGGVEVFCALFILFNVGKWIPYIILTLSFLPVLFLVSGTTLLRDIAILGGVLLLIHIHVKKENK